MEKIITTEQLPIKMWLQDAGARAMIQAKNLADLPFAFKHICLMPDTHEGYGMPIGGVLATDGVIIPNAVGVDIGCGMCAVKTNIYATNASAEQWKKIINGIRELVPMGFNHHMERQDESLMPEGYKIDELHVIRNQYVAATKQIGTLGGGNHFIEIQKDTDGFMWIMLHSGSRNLGKQVADYYNTKARKLNELWYSNVNPSVDLAFLPFKTVEAHDYYKEMHYCVEFAFGNRRLMVKRVLEVLSTIFTEVAYEPMINIAHNYAAWEEHFNQRVVIHRKGATSAKSGETGIIPGSQGTKSYIVEGLGNIDSFMSCSHGAGRIMGRKQAIQTLNLEEEQRKLDEQGIIHSVRTKQDLEEASSAYKDITKVMHYQSDLVKIKMELSPLAVLKG
jgi:tRNA-splicing ligase RtcB